MKSMGKRYCLLEYRKDNTSKYRLSSSCLVGGRRPRLPQNLVAHGGVHHAQKPLGGSATGQSLDVRLQANHDLQFYKLEKQT